MDKNELVKGTITDLHRQRASKPVPVADPAGAFPSTILPAAMPVVVDAMTLGRDLVRTSTRGRTILVGGASSGALRLFVARHAVAEIYEHLEDVWAPRANLSVEELEQVWRREYLPLLRMVDVPEGLLYPSEAERIAILATLDHEHGDPDDVPSATLALLLQAPFLSADRKSLRAVYGPDLDYEAHCEWLDVLRAGGDLGPLGDYLTASYLLTAGIAVGAYETIRSLLRVIPWQYVAIAVVAGAAAFHVLVPPERKAAILAGTKIVLREGWELLQVIVMNYVEAKARIDAMAPTTLLGELSVGLSSQAALERACIHDLARCRAGNQSAKELSDALWIEAPHGETKVRATLRGGSAFDQVYQGRFQVGRALVRQAAPIESSAQ